MGLFDHVFEGQLRQPLQGYRLWVAWTCQKPPDPRDTARTPQICLCTACHDHGECCHKVVLRKNVVGFFCAVKEGPRLDENTGKNVVSLVAFSSISESVHLFQHLLLKRPSPSAPARSGNAGTPPSPGARSILGCRSSHQMAHECCQP